jgi:hypothetical protein
MSEPRFVDTPFGPSASARLYKQAALRLGRVNTVSQQFMSGDNLHE